jgi:hypothetical protein
MTMNDAIRILITKGDKEIYFAFSHNHSLIAMQNDTSKIVCINDITQAIENILSGKSYE